LTVDGRPSLSEALTLFVAAKKNGRAAPLNHQELGRFVSWCGRDRIVVEVTPAQVADYAQYIGLGGPESAHRLNPVKVFLGYWKDQGWIQNGLVAHLRFPRSRRGTGRRGAGGNSRSPEGTYLSQEGYDRLVDQLEGLKGERGAVVEDIRQAMADKDFRENAPLDAAKERQGFLESRIRELESSLAGAQILKEGQTRPLQRSTVGTKVTLKDVGSGKKIVYRLVDVREADAQSGKISTSSPVGQALLDRLVGDEVTINVPKGTLHYLVERVDT
jgi:transcription elongation factor GreA